MESAGRDGDHIGEAEDLDWSRAVGRGPIAQLPIAVSTPAGDSSIGPDGTGMVLARGECVRTGSEDAGAARLELARRRSGRVVNRFTAGKRERKNKREGNKRWARHSASGTWRA
jgi:hypothetical protein